MRAVILCGGSISDYDAIHKHIKQDDLIICADSGYNHAVAMGLVPSVVVGDFDSIGSIPSDVPTIRHPVRKDQTDTEIALDHARRMGCRDFLFIAATGTRLDHTLANILLLKDCLDRGEQAQIIDEHNKIMLTRSRIHLRECPGSIVSLIPLSDCHGVTTQNLEYPLYEATLVTGTSLGVSNIMLEDSAVVSVQKGLLLVIIARD